MAMMTSTSSAGSAALAALALAACGVRGQQMEQSSLFERFERKSGQIAFIAIDGNVAIIDQAGNNLTQLTTDAGSRDGVRRWYGASAWSQREEQLAFVRFEQRDGQTRSTVFVSGRAGRSPQPIHETETLAPVYLYWSPDGRWISVLSQRPDTSEGFELGLLSADGERSYRPMDTGVPVYWAWDPNNEFMLAHVGGGSAGGGRLTLLDIDSGTIKHDFNVRPTRFQSPALSPDGKRMLYVDSESGSAQLVLRDVQGPGLSVLESISGSAFFSFSRNGRRVAIMESATQRLSADGTLRILQPDRSSSRVELKESSVIAFYWSPDGRRIAYLVPVQSDQIRLEQLFAADRELFYVHLRVMDARNGNSWLVATFPITTTSLGSLQFFDQQTRSATIWSPDGNWLVFSAVARGGFPGIFLGSASGNLEPRFVTSGDFGVWSRG